MPIARLQVAFSDSQIESESGIIRGVKVMELGKLATFAGEDGKPKSVVIEAAHISALLAHAGNRSIPSHWSHDWFDKTTDPIHDRIGALKNFRRDNGGDLIADLHLSPSKHRETALWNAANDASNMMLSAVFGYSRFDPKCIPQSFQACDVVATGAATTALFSDKSEPKSMEPKELAALIVAALSDKEHGPALKTALLSAMPKHEEPDGDECAKMEADAGVIDSDKVAGDDQKPALMRAHLRIGRALSRKSKQVEDGIAKLAADKSAILAEAKIQSAAEATALLGKGQFLKQGSGNQATDATAKFNGFVKELTDKGVALGAATQTVIQRESALYNEMNAALFRAPRPL